VEGRSAIPLTARYARDFARERLVLVGDAAHTIHPLAGQGVNLGCWMPPPWRSRSSFITAGGHRPARQPAGYERWRKSEAARMLAAMEGLKRLFAGSNPLKKLVRGWAARLRWSPPLKQGVIRAPWGWMVSCPPWPKGEKI
jgi:2-octaprenylphenol hydroxylase